RISEKRFNKLKNHATFKEKTVTQMIEDYIDKSPSHKIDDSLSPPYEYIEGGDFRDTLKAVSPCI
ncbi:MAG: hypothetical protein V7K86_14315, partial [Nostoc sp.]